MKKPKKIEWTPEEEVTEEEETDEASSDATLEEDMAEPDLAEEPAAEGEKEVGMDDLAEPLPSWGEPDALELEKPAAELEPEIPLERLEEQEVIDDSVRMYLHEIGRVPLLTAEDEKILAKQMEEGRRISEIRRDWQKKNGRAPKSSEIVWTILNELAQHENTIHVNQKELGVQVEPSFIKTISNKEYRESIDAEIIPELIQSVATGINRSVIETEQVIITISININLVPDQVLDIVDKKVSFSKMMDLLKDDKFKSSLDQYETELAAYFVILNGSQRKLKDT
jgi:RNA polymerase primary sigma factor